MEATEPTAKVTFYAEFDGNRFDLGDYELTKENFQHEVPAALRMIADGVEAAIAEELAGEEDR